MIQFEGAQGGDFDRWGQGATAAIERLDGREDLEAQRLLALAIAHGITMRVDVGLELAEQGWIIAQRAFEQRPEARLSAAEAAVRLRLYAGRNREALDLAEAARTEAITRYGRHHPVSARQRATVGTALYRLGRYEEAEAEFVAALGVLEEEWGPTSPNLVMHRLSLGHAQSRLGRYQEALATFESLRASTPTPNHTLVLALLAEVDIEILVEDWSAARERAAEARVVVEQIAGADSPIAAAAYSQAALVHVLTGEHERAWPLLEQADGIADQAALPVSFRVHLWSTRGKALHAAGRATEAVPEFEKAVALQEQVGAEVLDRAQVDFHLARALHETGEEDRALALGRDALATFVTLGPGARVYRQWTEDWLDEIGAAR